MKSKVIAALVAVGMMVSVANATDVYKLKVDGIGLGDSYNKIKKKLPCQSSKRVLSSGGYAIDCTINNSNNRITKDSHFIFDQNDRVTEIHFFTKMYSASESDIDSEINRFKSIYGEPDMTAQYKLGWKSEGNKNGFSKDICWGKCKKEYKEDPAYSVGDTINGGDLYLLIGTNSFNLDYFSVSIDLQDRKADERRTFDKMNKISADNIDKKIQKLHNKSQVTWKVKSKFDNPKSYDPEHSATVYNISCSNGKSDVVSYFYNMQYGQYSVSGRAGMESLDEAANSICGN